MLKRQNNENVDYEVYFMRKLWINFVPGKDEVADNIFNFPQEKPKYTRGYYNISSTLVGKLGALIFISQFGHDRDKRKALLKGQLNDQLLPSGHKVEYF